MNYRLVCNDRFCCYKGGIFIYYKGFLYCIFMDFFFFKYLEVLVCWLGMIGYSVVILVFVYFLFFFNIVLEVYVINNVIRDDFNFIFGLSDFVILVGDFNVKYFVWNSSIINFCGKVVFDLCFIFFFDVIVLMYFIYYFFDFI